MQVVAANDIAFTAGLDLTIESAQNLFEEETSSRSAGVSLGGSVRVGIGGITPTLSGNASFNRASGTQSSVTQVNSAVTAGGDIKLASGRDTTVAGANIAGTDIDIDVGRNFTVESRQDTAEGETSSFGLSVGGSIAGEFAVEAKDNGNVSVGPGGLVVRPNGVGAAFAAGQLDAAPTFSDTLGVNVGVSVGSGSNSSAAVTNQTTIVGTGDVDITVGDHTAIDGAVIAAIDDETGEDTGNLSLSTGTLDVTDIADINNGTQFGIGVNASINDPFRSRSEPEGEALVPGLGDALIAGLSGDTVQANALVQNLAQDTLEAASNRESFEGRSRLDQFQNLPAVSVDYNSTRFAQTTAGAIGEGEIEARDEPDFDPDGINRDISETQIVTRDDEINISINIDPVAIGDIIKLFDDERGNSTLEQLADELSAALDGDPETLTAIENDFVVFSVAQTIASRSSTLSEEQALIKFYEAYEQLGVLPNDLNEIIALLDDETIEQLGILEELSELYTGPEFNFLLQPSSRDSQNLLRLDSRLSETERLISKLEDRQLRYLEARLGKNHKATKRFKRALNNLRNQISKVKTALGLHLYTLSELERARSFIVQLERSGASVNDINRAIATHNKLYDIATKTERKATDALSDYFAAEEELTTANNDIRREFGIDNPITIAMSLVIPGKKGGKIKKKDKDDKKDNENSNSRRVNSIVTGVNNAVNIHVTRKDLSGLDIELGGGSTGFDHITEAEETRRALVRLINRAKNLLSNPNVRLTSSERRKLNRAIGKASRAIDQIDAVFEKHGKKPRR